MSISNTPINQTSKVRLQSAGSSKVKIVDSAAKSDEVIISDLARQVQDVKKYISSLADGSRDLVDDLKRRVSEGSYEVSTDDLANAMFAAPTMEVEGF